MPFCPKCGFDVGSANFCFNCGTQQGSGKQPSSGGSPHPQTVKVTPSHQYDSGICLLLCCCLSPLAALIYYLLTDHPEKYLTDKQYRQYL